jgi:hypothetical protein
MVNTTSYPLWQVVLGVHENEWSAWLWAFAALLLAAYNIVRYFLTLQIAPLRDAEDRSSATPARGAYLPLYAWHERISPIFWIARVLLVVNVIQFLGWFLFARVALPNS